MNQQFLNKINQELIKALKSRYKFEDAKVLSLSEAGRSSIKDSLKQYVLKHGTPEIEGILLDKIQFNGSALQAFCYANFHKDIAEKKMLDVKQTNEVAEFSINYLIEQFKEGFKDSGNTRDIDGICKFLDIDKKILRLVNSPIGKIFGKFF